MTTTAFNRAAAPNLQPLLERLERVHFPASRFTEPRPGTVAAQFFQSRLTSDFQPVVRADDGETVGHHAHLRVFDEGGEPAAPWGVFAQASKDAMLVQLDRLTRTVHALNYFPLQDAGRMLYLNVEPRLLTVVADNHGAYFELILGQLGIAPKRVAIVLPASSLDDPVTFVRAAISYRMRGYRVVVQLRSDAEADLEHVYLAEPHDVALDAPSPSVHGQGEGSLERTRKLINALHRRGIHAIARHVEYAEQAQAAREVGFAFLQGSHFA